MPARHPALAEVPIGPFGLTAPPPIEIECPAYTGSLAALFTCLRAQRIDLLGVPLAPICEAYYHYLIEAAAEDVDAAATALLALSYLIERKSWLLLSAPEQEEPEQEELGAPFESTVGEYGPVIESLRQLSDEREQTFFRGFGSAPYEMPFDLGNITSADLASAIGRVLARATPDIPETLAHARRSLSEQMTLAQRALRASWRAMEAMVEGPLTRMEAVWWFLALLELIRLGQARARVTEGELLFALPKAA